MIPIAGIRLPFALFNTPILLQSSEVFLSPYPATFSLLLRFVSASSSAVFTA